MMNVSGANSGVMSQSLTSMMNGRINEATATASSAADEWNRIYEQEAMPWQQLKSQGLVGGTQGKGGKKGHAATVDPSAQATTGQQVAASVTLPAESGGAGINQQDLMAAYLAGMDQGAAYATLDQQQSQSPASKQDDGQFMFGLKSLGHFVKGAVINPIKGLAEFATSGPLQFAATVAGAALLASPAVAALGPLMVVTAAAGGAYSIGKFLVRHMGAKDGAERAAAFEDLGSGVSSLGGAWLGAIPALNGAKTIATKLQTANAVKSLGTLDKLADTASMTRLEALKANLGILGESTRNSAYLAKQPGTWQAIPGRVTQGAEALQAQLPTAGTKALSLKDQAADWVRQLGHGTPETAPISP